MAALSERYSARERKTQLTSLAYAFGVAFLDPHDCGPQRPALGVAAGVAAAGFRAQARTADLKSAVTCQSISAFPYAVGTAHQLPARKARGGATSGAEVEHRLALSLGRTRRETTIERGSDHENGELLVVELHGDDSDFAQTACRRP